MKLKYQISLTIIITLLIINSSLMTSYSLWIVNKSQTGSNLVKAGCFEILFNDLDSNEVNTSINLTNTYPISDLNGEKLKPYKVTLTNSCSIAANYKLVISEATSNTLDSGNIRYVLKNNEGTTFGPSDYNSLTPYVMENSIKNNIETEKNTEIKNSYILATGILNPNNNATYELRLWVKENANNTIMEKDFTSIVSLEAVATEIQSL